MQTSRRVLLDDFVLYVGDAGDATTRTRASRLLDRVLETIWMKREWSQFLMPNPFQPTTVPNINTIPLPDYFGRISGADRIIRNLTNATRILPMPRNDVEYLDPKQGTALEIPGPPRYYEIAGTAPVQIQPAAGGAALEVISSSAADVQVRAYIEGLNAFGIVTQTQVTLNGTNPVALGTFAAPLTKFGKAYPDGIAPTTTDTSSEGTVTLRLAGGGTTLQTLAPDQDAREHLTIVLYPVPDQPYQLAVPIVRAIEQYYKEGDPIPPFWREAVFEKMLLAWRVGDRDGAMVDNTDNWPALTDLVCLENQRIMTGWSTTPYGGGMGY